MIRFSDLLRRKHKSKMTVQNGIIISLNKSAQFSIISQVNQDNCLISLLLHPDCFYVTLGQIFVMLPTFFKAKIVSKILSSVTAEPYSVKMFTLWLLSELI